MAGVGGRFTTTCPKKTNEPPPGAREKESSPHTGARAIACNMERSWPLADLLLHYGLGTTELQTLFAAACDESDHSAKQRHDGDLAGVHGVTSS
jgi:hypothetical protein